MKWVKIIGYGLVAVIVIMIFSGQAVGAAHLVNSIASGATGFAKNLSTFVSNLHL
jgi:hypothetical protein